MRRVMNKITREKLGKKLEKDAYEK